MIIDLDTAKRELRKVDDDDDERITVMIGQATALVLHHLKVADDEYENLDGLNDFPDAVAAAVLGALKSLYYDPDKDPLTPVVKAMLHPLRDPALA